MDMLSPSFCGPVAKSRDSVWFTIVKRLAASVARRNGRENFLVPPLNEQPGKQN